MAESGKIMSGLQTNEIRDCILVAKSCIIPIVIYTEHMIDFYLRFYAKWKYLSIRMDVCAQKCSRLSCCQHNQPSDLTNHSCRFS